MRNIIAIAQKELRVYFLSPMAYVLIGVFLLISGFFFYNILMYFNMQSIQYGANPYYSSHLNINQFVYSSFFHNTSIILLLILPLLTMRLFAEEKKMGTEELLFTSPLSTWQIVLGKFFSAVVILLIMLLSTSIYSIFTFLYGNPQLEPILTGYLGLLLLGASFIAIGIFTSSLTENQIVAAILGFGTLLLFWVISWASDNVGPLWREILTRLSFFEHYEDLVKGVIDTEDVIYYLSVSFFGLFLAHTTIEAKKWR